MAKKTIPLSLLCSGEFKPRTKCLALLLVFSLIFPTVGWAFERGTFSVSKPLLPAEWLTRIPKQLASVESMQPGNGPMVLHIQDLHCNYEVQNNIAQLLAYLAKDHGLRTLFVEGASQPIQTGKLASFPDATVKAAVGHHLLRQGKISGAEYFAATSTLPIRLLGAENSAEYEASRIQMSKLLAADPQAVAREIKTALEKAKPGVYSKPLAEFDHICRNQEDGVLSWYAYCRFLQKFSATQAYPLASFPALQAYLQSGKPEIGAEIETEKLFLEAGQLAKKIRQGLYQTSEERELDELLERLGVLQNVLGLTASADELQTLKTHPRNYRVQVFIDYLWHRFHGAVRLEQEFYQLDVWLPTALKFYELADKRSEIFVQNTLAQLDQQPGTELVVLVTGGYHTSRVLEKFSQAHLACLSLKPHWSEADADNPYFDRVNHHETALEQMLCRSRQFLAPMPLFTQEPGTMVEAQLPALTQKDYDLIQGLLRAADLEGKWSAHKRLNIVRSLFELDFKNYRADSGRFSPDFKQAKIYGDVLLIPLQTQAAKRLWPFLVIHPVAESLSLPSSIDQLVCDNLQADFYPGPMRADIQTYLAQIEFQGKWDKLQHRILSLLRESFKPIAQWLRGNRETTSASAVALDQKTRPKLIFITFYKELFDDLKLAIGLFPFLYSLSLNGVHFTWMLGTSGAVFLLISLGVLLANAVVQQRWVGLREMAGHFTQEVKYELAGIQKHFQQNYREFIRNKRHHPKSSWGAMLLIVAARIFDYATLLPSINSGHALLGFSVLGMALVFIGWLLLRHRKKTEWLESTVGKAVQIIVALTVVELLKIPVGAGLVLILGGSAWTGSLQVALLRWLKKIIGVFSATDFLLSLENWVKKKKRQQKNIWTRINQPIRGFSWLALIKENIQPGKPIRQATGLFLIASMMFAALKVSMPLQGQLLVQTCLLLLMLLQWRVLSRNPQISPKVKVMTLSSLLPVAFVVVGLLLVSNLGALQEILGTQLLPAVAWGNAQHLQLFLTAAKEKYLSLAVSLAFAYSLLGFSNVLKDEDKLKRLSEAAPERVRVLDQMVNEYLQIAIGKLRPENSSLPEKLQQVCETGRVTLVSRKMQTEWMAGLLDPGVFSMGRDIYFRRRLFNLLGDQTAAILIFRERLRQAGLTEAKVTGLVAEITGKNLARMDSLVALILKNDHSDEAHAALELELGQDSDQPEKRAAYQRGALERRYQITFPVPPGTYQPEFAGSFYEMNIKLKILRNYGIEPHPWFFKYTAAEVERAAAVCQQYLARGTEPDLVLYQQAMAESVPKPSSNTQDQCLPAWQRPLGWLMRASWHLPGLRLPMERFWLRHFQTFFIRSLLPVAQSPLALGDSKTRCGQALAAWNRQPSEKNLRDVMEAMLLAAETAPDPHAQAMALQQISYLCAHLAHWQGQPYGLWMDQTGKTIQLYQPLLFLLPGYQSLAGRYAELLHLQPGICLDHSQDKKYRHRFHRFLAQLA